MTSVIAVDNLLISSQGKVISHLPALTLERKEFVTLVGPSGSGKSTLLKYLVQLQDPSLQVEGSYLYQGKEIHKWDPIRLRKEVSYCSQTPSLFGETVSDNLFFPAEIRQEKPNMERIIRLMEELGLEEGYLDKKIEELSGGEKQRLALVRNLIYLPVVLLLDEVTSALDAENRHLVWQGIHQLREKDSVSIIMVSHDQREWGEADRIVRIEKEENHVQ